MVSSGNRVILLYIDEGAVIRKSIVIKHFSMVTMQVLLLVFLVIANICLNSLYGYSLSSSVNIFKTKRTSTSILHSNDISSTNKIESCGSCVNAPKCSGEYLSKGCDGTGKIQGGIATVSLFSWWPIKVFRPCPSYLQAGYVYRREGQTMDQVSRSTPLNHSIEQNQI